jgi:hypothetical protein
MKLGVFMLWTEMRVTQGASPVAGAAVGGADAHLRTAADEPRWGLGDPFEHDDVLPSSLRIGARAMPGGVRPEAVTARPDTTTMHPDAASAKPKKSSAPKLPDARKLAEVVGKVRAKRAQSKADAPRRNTPARSTPKPLHAR